MNRKFREKVKIAIWAKNSKYMDTSVVIKPELRVQNKFANKFFDTLNNRLEGIDNNVCKNTLIVTNYLFTIIKTLLIIYIKLSIDIRISLGDVSFLIGGIEGYTNFAILMSFIVGLYFHKLFHFTSNKKLFTWLKLFDMTRGLIPPKQLHLYPVDTSVLKKFLKRTKLVLLLVQYSMGYFGFMIALSYTFIFLEFLTVEQILSGIPATVLMCVGCYYLIVDFFIAISLLYLIFYYFELRCIKVNKKLTNLYSDTGLNNSTVGAVISDHNTICSQIANYNKFWQKQYSGIIFCVLPISLVLLHQVLFEELKFYTQVLFSFGVVCSWIFIFLISYLASLVSHRIHITAQKIYKIQWRFVGTAFDPKVKIRLMMCFERVNSVKKIGFSVRSLAVMTYPALYRLIVMYIRYFILTHKLAKKKKDHHQA